MKKLGFILIILFLAFISEAQSSNCVFKPPQFTIHFGAGDVSDPNSRDLSSYQRVFYSCPSDGYYAFVPYTHSCFHDDWHSLSEDHTPGDVEGNMLLVNAARYPGTFLRIPVTGLKSNTIYEIGLWLMNLCKPTKKCPSVLLPNIYIRLETPEGKIVANIATGDLPRVEVPRWTQHRALFTTPASTTSMMLVMTDNVPSGCGNDFALDDITFRECVKQTKPPVVVSKTTTSAKQPTVSKSSPKKATPPPPKKDQTTQVIKPKPDSAIKTSMVLKPGQKISASTPLVLKTRENALVRKIETEAGAIKIEIYDNGEIDGDTVSIYHNNVLIRTHQRLSQKPITFNIDISQSESHHEIIMVAENLGSIPPNTSIMIITMASNRYELMISSSEQKNAKVVFDLKK